MDVGGVDTEALKRRYRLERDRRVAAARDDIADLTGPLARYLDDPYSRAEPREAVADEVDVVVVGAGFGGLMSAGRLREQGVERVRLIDKGGDVGGVWYWNRYPGAMCDVESYIYLPLLEETGYIPRTKYAVAEEIFEHTRRIAARFGLYDLALFHTAVTGMTWDEQAALWRVTTDRGDRIGARYVVLANGSLSTLKVPAIPGIETFRGESFHTSRWNYSYTGGSATMPLAGLADKAVGVVGTGASAVQVVPPVARAARELYVIQRTPSTVAVRANRPTDPEFARTLTGGWQSERMRNFTALVSGVGAPVDYVADGWTELYGAFVVRPNASRADPAQLAREKELADFRKMEEVRARIDSIVTDPGTAEALKPWYAYLCKRPCFHDEFLDAFNMPGVTLVDTQGQGIERVLPDGVEVGGVRYQLDCIIWATGFEFDTPYTDRIGFDVVGRAGCSLAGKWQQGVATLHGITTRHFPNLLVVPNVNMQSAVTVNFSHTLQESAIHIAYIVGECRRRGIRAFDVSEAAEQDWVKTIVTKSKSDRAFQEACTPGRNNHEGRPELRPAQNANYGPGPLSLFDLMEGWRAGGDLPGLELE